MKLIEQILQRKDYKITSPYGMRYHPIENKWKMHNGVDYGTNRENWHTFALEQGKVRACGYDKSAGNYIWIMYPRLNIETCYFHLKDYYVKKGQIVEPYKTLGRVGTTGSSSGIHLHLGVRTLDTKKYFNPELYDYQPEDTMLVVDGMWGTKVTKELQRYYQTIIDGIISGQIKQKANENIYTIKFGLGGSNLVRKIQKDLGIKVDGYLGKGTISALQSRLGSKVTGYINAKDDETVIKIQTLLNEGKVLM
jgi:murein DD-endopeptidase MepM/ murein hydrolase activator NlpD